jgi:hypothetical protein
LCMAGDRLCATGQPSTPRRVSGAINQQWVGELPPFCARADWYFAESRRNC